MASDTPVIDLHCHTTASDGRTTPAQLVEVAVASGVDVIAVTDHDTCAGIAEAKEAARGGPVRVISGIELSARYAGRNVHVLGYLIDPSSDLLRSALAEIVSDRVERAKEMIAALGSLGYELTMDEVLEQASGEVIARPHIARAIVARGYVRSVREAFSPDLIADGGAADVEKKTLEPAAAVELLRAAGGAPVIAHPGVGHHDGPVQAVPVELLAELKDAGLVGIEVDHPDHPPLVRERLAALASELGLVQTGGSDYHGDEGHVLGGWTTTERSLLALEDACS